MTTPPGPPLLEAPPRGYALFRHYMRRLGASAVIFIASATLPLLGFTLLLFSGKLGVDTWLRDHGAAGVAVYAAGLAVLSGFALLPTWVSALLGGWAFGFFTGLAGAMVGIFGGSLVAYTIVRLVSHDRVRDFVDEHPRWRTVREAIMGRGFWRHFLVVFLVRLPSTPFAITNAALASMHVRAAPYLLGTVLGMIPRTAAATFIASQLQHKVFADVSGTAKPWWLVIASVVSAMLVVVVLSMIAKHALGRVTAGPVPAGTPAADRA